MWSKPKPPAEQMRLLLEEERALLLRGDLSRLADLTPQKIKLQAGLKDIGDAIVLESLGRIAKHNAKLLSAALAGVRAAADRLATLKAPAPAMSTYNSSGQSSAIGGPTRGDVFRRA